jgi:hypothetical protein
MPGPQCVKKNRQKLVSTARVANVKSSVANDEIGFKVLTLKDLLESSKISRQPIGRRGTELKE